MNKIINRYQAVYGTTWLIIFAIMITLWPLRLVTEKIVSGSNRQISMSSEAITEDYMVQYICCMNVGANHLFSFFMMLPEMF